MSALAQDLPPIGGFDPIRYKRNLPNRGPPGYVLLGGVVLLMTGGFYFVGYSNYVKREIQREKAERRIALVPLLLAEEDQRYVIWKQAQDRKERIIMKDNKDWVYDEKIYNSKKWTQPAHTQRSSGYAY